MSIATEQVPGYYRRRVGDVLVTTLFDGAIVLPPEVRVGVTAAEQDAMYRAAGHRPPFATAINTFLLQWPGKTVLVDTGAGALVGPTAGKMLSNLRAAGGAPEAVDAILLTHLHIDHLGGLLDGSGAPVFPKAQLYIPDAEAAYWLDESAKAAAPERLQDSFDLARKTLAPYTGRLHRFTDRQVLEDVEAIAMPGHTPGHTGYLISSHGDSLLIWGDMMNAPAIQGPRPAVTLVFDTDPAQGVATRRKVLEQAVAQDTLVAGMHLPFPAFSRVTRSGEGYQVQLEPWSMLPA